MESTLVICASPTRLVQETNTSIIVSHLANAELKLEKGWKSRFRDFISLDSLGEFEEGTGNYSNPVL